MVDRQPLCILQWNANGLCTRLHELLLLLITLRIQMALIQETHLEASVDTRSAFSLGFQIFRKDRDHHGGGLLTLVLRSLTAQEVPIPAPPGSHLELLGVRLWTQQRRLLLVNIYRPPSAPTLSLDFLQPLQAPLLVSGDLRASFSYSRALGDQFRKMDSELSPWCYRTIDYKINASCPTSI